jgi:hypothetical protein
MGQAVDDTQDRIATAGLSGQEYRTGLPGKDSQAAMEAGTGRTGHKYRDRQNRT